MQNIDFKPLEKLNRKGLGKPDKYTYVLFFIIIFTIIIGVFVRAASGGLFFVLIMGIFVTVVYQSYKQAKQSDLLFINFAGANNWEYKQKIEVNNKPGSIYGLGSIRTALDVISGNLRGLPFSSYEYIYTTGSGKSQQTHYLQVFELTLPRAMPHMVIDSLVESGSYGASTLPIKFAGSQRIELEGDFSKYFSLYAPDNYGVTALTVLAPDAMAALMDHASKCDIEIINNKMYFYWPITPKDKDDYEEVFLTVDSVLDKTLDKLTTSDVFAHTSQSALHSSAQTAGVRLKKSFWTSSVQLTLIVAFVSLILIGSMLVGQNPSSTTVVVTIICLFLLVMGLFGTAIYMVIRKNRRQKAFYKRSI